MAKKIYTADELNKCDKETLAAIILALQDQVETLNQNILHFYPISCSQGSNI